MILQLNDFRPLTGSDIAKYSRLTHDEYPEQDERFLGKNIKLPYKDFEKQTLHLRINIKKNWYPEYDGPESDEPDLFWKIVRFDKDYEYVYPPEPVMEDFDYEEDAQPEPQVKLIPGIAIFKSVNNQYLCCTTDIIKRMKYYPFYTLGDNEVLLDIVETWEEFNESIKEDVFLPLPAQEKMLINNIVYTEYWKDIFRYTAEVNKMIIPEDQHPTFAQIKEHLLASNPDNEDLQDVLLRSFPKYYNRHEKHMIDEPRRAINQGTLVRIDEASPGNGIGSIIVKETLENGTTRYVLGTEAFIYWDTYTVSAFRHIANLLNTL